MTHRPPSETEAQRFCEMWNDPSVTISAIARAFNFYDHKYANRTAQRLGLGPKPRQRDNWPTAITSRMHELFDEGLSRGAIAVKLKEELGDVALKAGVVLNRSSVSGKCAREGLRRSDPDACIAASNKARAAARSQERARARKERMAREAERRGPIPLRPAAKPKRNIEELDAALRAAGELPEPKPFEARAFGECAWVVGEVNGAETKCCGAPIFKGSWCARHWAIGRRPSTAAKAYDRRLGLEELEQAA